MVAEFRHSEEKDPTFDLRSIQVEFSSVDRLRMTKTAEKNAAELGFDLEDIVLVIGAIQPSHFFKSMNTPGP
jgi:hypothetical protein